MKRPLDIKESSEQEPPNKSKRMGASIICPKEDNTYEEETTMNDQVEQMEAVATGEGRSIE